MSFFLSNYRVKLKVVCCIVKCAVGNFDRHIRICRYPSTATHIPEPVAVSCTHVPRVCVCVCRFLWAHTCFNYHSFCYQLKLE